MKAQDICDMITDGVSTLNDKKWNELAIKE